MEVVDWCFNHRLVEEVTKPEFKTFEAPLLTRQVHGPLAKEFCICAVYVRLISFIYWKLSLEMTHCDWELLH